MRHTITRALLAAALAAYLSAPAYAQSSAPELRSTEVSPIDDELSDALFRLSWQRPARVEAGPENAADDVPLLLTDFRELAFQDESEEPPATQDTEAEVRNAPAWDGDGIIEPGEDETAELARAAQNPVADMISLPFQNNTLFGVGPRERVANVLNIQPVIPFDLNEDWILITRTIVPVIYRPAFRDEGSDFGLGDIQFTAFFSPRDSGGWTWGVGPVFRFPTATDDSLGSEKWSVGPSAVVLRMDGPWVYGAVAQNVWSFAGDSDRKHVNEFLMQPFINYNLSDGWYLVTAPIVTANWNTDKSSDRWSVPVGGGFGRIFRIGKQPVNMSVQAYNYVAKPSFGPDWEVRVQFQLLFPKRK